jgi:hypothetical protein
MLTNCFRRDFRSKVYGERGLAGQSLRLRPYDEIEQIIAQERATLLVAKPIVESQHALKLLSHFSESKAIWMYRDYRDVARSSLRKHGPQSTMRNLRPIATLGRGEPETGRPDDGHSWASEAISDRTRKLVARYFAEDMPIVEAKALFWYIRNMLYFEQQLDEHPRVTLCKYEEIVADPVRVMTTIYRFLGIQYPGDYIAGNIHRRSVGLGKQLEIKEEIEHLCKYLLNRMDEDRAAQDDPL